MNERIFSKDEDFFIFVVNHSKKLFNILKVYGETEINQQVIAKREETGDDIRASVSKTTTIENLNQKVNEYKQMGLQYTTKNLIQRFKKD